MIDPDKLRAELDQHGEAAVKLKFAQGAYGVEKRAFVEHWLREKAAERETAAAVKQETREEENLRLSREANTIAAEANAIAKQAITKSETANRIAWIAGIISVGGLILQWWLGR